MTQLIHRTAIRVKSESGTHNNRRRREHLRRRADEARVGYDAVCKPTPAQKSYIVRPRTRYSLIFVRRLAEVPVRPA